MNTLTSIKVASATVGAFIGYFVGGFDGIMVCLVWLMIADYITGVMVAISRKELSSAVGFLGICRKVTIVILVAVAHTLDADILQTGDAVRNAVICFYVANEGISILENSVRLGLPVPEAIKNVLIQIKGE